MEPNRSEPHPGRGWVGLAAYGKHKITFTYIFYFFAEVTYAIMEGVEALGRRDAKGDKQMEQLKIGQVTASEAIVQEITETEDFQVFCMSCVRRHRSGDWGDVPKDQWIRNNQAARKGGVIVSEYTIPEIFRLGYADRIIVTTAEERTETRIMFPDDD